MAQLKLDGSTFTDKESVEVKTREKTRKAIKKAKLASKVNLSQRRVSGERISSKVVEFHNDKDLRRKVDKRNRRKIAEEKSARIEQVRF